jgi:hypothetical protein
MKPIVYKPQPDPIPEGPNHAAIPAVHDLGSMANFDRTGEIRTLAIGFELVNERIGGIRRIIWKRVNGESLHPKSNLGKILAAVGASLKPGEEFDPTSLIGKNLTLLITHTAKDDRVYADVAGYAKLASGVAPVVPEHKPDEPAPNWLKPQPSVNNSAPQW